MQLTGSLSGVLSPHCMLVYVLTGIVWMLCATQNAWKHLKWNCFLFFFFPSRFSNNLISAANLIPPGFSFPGILWSGNVRNHCSRRINKYFYIFCVRDEHKETQRKSQEGVTEGSLVMSHMFFIFTHYFAHNRRTTADLLALWSERGSQVFFLSVADGGGEGGLLFCSLHHVVSYRLQRVRHQDELLCSGEQEKYEQCLSEVEENKNAAFKAALTRFFCFFFN